MVDCRVTIANRTQSWKTQKISRAPLARGGDGAALGNLSRHPARHAVTDKVPGDEGGTGLANACGDRLAPCSSRPFVARPERHAWPLTTTLAVEWKAPGTVPKARLPRALPRQRRRPAVDALCSAHCIKALDASVPLVFH